MHSLAFFSFPSDASEIYYSRLEDLTAINGNAALILLTYLLLFVHDRLDVYLRKLVFIIFDYINVEYLYGRSAEKLIFIEID